MTIGRAGGAAGDSCCFQPNDVITNQKGEIFVAEGHSSAAGAMARIQKFTPDGKLITVLGRRGAGSGEFDQPHGLAFDSQGRLFVADRGNNRVQIIDQQGAFIASWPQFSRPSGVWVDRNDMLYSADSESGSVNPAHKAWVRGIRVGSVKDGKVTAFIPDPQKELMQGTLAAEGVAVDHQGNIYGAEVGPRQVVKYVRR
jgi:DNA-binding beta-propeller fold protein YncE